MSSRSADSLSRPPAALWLLNGPVPLSAESRVRLIHQLLQRGATDDELKALFDEYDPALYRASSS